MVLIVWTGDSDPEEVVDMYECLSELARDEADEDRRNEVRML